MDYGFGLKLAALAFSYLSGCAPQTPEETDSPDDTSNPIDTNDSDECESQNPPSYCPIDTDTFIDTDETADTDDTDETGQPDVCAGATGVLMSESPRLSLFGESEWSGIGDVQAAGDFNCDGVTDLAVGDQSWTDEVTGTGRVYVFFGGASSVFVDGGTIADADVIISPSVPSSLAGSLAAVDLNNDGCDDLITDELGARVLYGARTLASDYFASDLPTIPDLHVSSQWGLTALGDIDGDGLPEVAVKESDGTKIFDVNGEQAQITTSFLYARNPNVWQMAGGDINGDGFNDLVMAAADDGAFSGVYVLMGDSSLQNEEVDGERESVSVQLPQPGQTLAGQEVYSFWTGDSDAGIQSVFAGDYDGDGLADVAASFIQFDNGHSNSGFSPLMTGASFVAADFENGSENILGLNDPTFTDTTDVYGDIEDAYMADMFGFMRDGECGFGNLVLGSSQYAGGATVFNMTDYTLATAGTRKAEDEGGEMTVAEADQRFTGRNYSRVLVGDFNGDGVQDVCLGSPSEDRIDCHPGERHYEGE